MKNIKRIALGLLATAFTFSLSSCKVNMIDRQYDVPWWVIAVPVCIFSVAVFYFAGKHISKKRFTCSKCDESFYPSFWVAVFSLHVNDERYFKCPHCGQKSFCYPKSDLED